tara:strand:+ start:234 stop:551 length:318 start_codon:yes stop_codon:yes gene_type:complete
LIDGVFEVTGFKVFNGSNGLFVKPPQHKGRNKEGEEEWFDDVRFVGDTSKEIRMEVYQSVIDAYNTKVRNSSQTTSANIQSNIGSNNANNNTNQPNQNKTRTPLW